MFFSLQYFVSYFLFVSLLCRRPNGQPVTAAAHKATAKLQQTFVFCKHFLDSISNFLFYPTFSELY